MAEAEDDILSEAIDAISKGQRSRARDLLTRLLKSDQGNSTYWLWMSSVVESKKEKIYCLESVLRIDPKNATALKGIVLLGGQPASENIAPSPIVKREWTVALQEETNIPANGSKVAGLKSKISNPILRISLYIGVGIIVLGMILAAIFGLGSDNRKMFGAVQLTVTPKPWTPKPTATVLPTNTPRVKTPTPTFIGPTPLWMLLEATYTPTPLYVNTPHPISEAYRAGIRAYHSGDIEGMLSFMEQALDLEPGSADTNYYIGEAHRLMGNNELALTSYETSISTNETFAPGYLGRAMIYLTINPDLGVEEDLNKAISLDPNLVEAYLALAEYYLLINEPEAALETLEYFDELDVESPFIHLFRSQANLILEKTDLALEFAQEAMELDQTLLATYFTLGEIYLQMDFPRRAAEYMEIYTLYVTDSAKAWALLGESYYKMGQNDKAMEALNASIEIDEINYEVSLYRGYIYLDEEEGQLAVNEFFNARTLIPDSFEACVGMADALLIAGRQGDALKQILSCQNLVADDKQQAIVFYHRAIIYEAIGNFKSAAEDWVALLDFPDGIVTRNWRTIAEKHLSDLTPTPTSTTTQIPLTETPSD
jgi:tetratricopeptide (TPR) repeat protein